MRFPGVPLGGAEGEAEGGDTAMGEQAGGATPGTANGKGGDVAPSPAPSLAPTIGDDEVMLPPGLLLPLPPLRPLPVLRCCCLRLCSRCVLGVWLNPPPPPGCPQVLEVIAGGELLDAVEAAEDEDMANGEGAWGAEEGGGGGRRQQHQRLCAGLCWAALGGGVHS